VGPEARRQARAAGSGVTPGGTARTEKGRNFVEKGTPFGKRKATRRKRIEGGAKVGAVAELQQGGRHAQGHEQEAVAANQEIARQCQDGGGRVRAGVFEIEGKE